MRDLWLVNCNTDYGIYLHFDLEVDRDLKNEISAFLRWIRKNYKFPVKLNIRISSEYRVKTYATNEEVCGTVFFPDSKKYNPIIRIATGDYDFLIAKQDKFSAGCIILSTIAHEITHYFQWLKDMSDNNKFSERQATYKSRQIVNKYLDYCFDAGYPEPFSEYI